MKIFVGISGASGTIYGGRLLRALEGLGHEVTTCFSDGAVQVIRAEEGDDDVSPSRQEVIARFAERYGLSHSLAQPAAPQEMGSEMASGSSLVEAAVVCPCSMSSLACIASGVTRNLIHRVADVMLKESRILALVPRETPLSDIHLRNMLRVRRAGALLVPAMPAYYHHPETIDDLADFVAGKVLDAIGVRHELYRRWQGEG
ncbi:putative aromatic acid decarboxylase [bacterium BMS3Abin01]|nr:putative aromatic acid decarboxylase [bacterium BMS3Abin01]